ncbi:MAG TPA: hypothetical protein DCX95_07810 [Elusimicrobia bacterium]|nr:hypothetical protein [Elusimicrobiota bacterium]
MPAERLTTAPKSPAETAGNSGHTPEQASTCSGQTIYRRKNKTKLIYILIFKVNHYQKKLLGLKSNRRRSEIENMCQPGQLVN